MSQNASMFRGQPTLSKPYTMPHKNQSTVEDQPSNQPIRTVQSKSLYTTKVTQMGPHQQKYIKFSQVQTTPPKVDWSIVLKTSKESRYSRRVQPLNKMTEVLNGPV